MPYPQRVVLDRVRRVREDLGPELLRDIALVCLAVGVVGASYGAITVSEGLPVWTPSYMSVVVFAGASQFLFTGVVGRGRQPGRRGARRVCSSTPGTCRSASRSPTRSRTSGCWAAT